MQNFMMEGVTPYGELTSLSIQSIIYKGPISAGQFPYHVNIPLTMLLLFLPLAWIKDLALARAIWLIILELGLFGVVIVSLRLAHWRPHWAFLIVILVFSVFWLPSVSMFVTATSIVIQTLVFYGALRSIQLGSDELGGALAALCLLNIEATGLVFFALIVWIFSTRRWRILGGIVMVMAILLGLSFVLLPDWVFPFMGATLSNWQSGIMPSTFNLFEGWLPGIGQRLAQILAVAAFTIIFLEWRAVRGQNVRWLFWTTCLTATLTPLLGIPYFQSWLVLTLPGVLLIVSIMVERWRLLGFGSAIITIAGLFLGLWGAQLYGITSAFILFYPLTLTMLLYWVRWGAVRQAPLWADQVTRRR